MKKIVNQSTLAYLDRFRLPAEGDCMHQVLCRGWTVFGVQHWERCLEWRTNLLIWWLAW